MSNAAKFRKKAAELESQRDFDKAIVHYARAIEAGDAAGEEVDVAVLNKVGDLTLRLGRVPEAVASYERAVDHYTTVGLFNNAIALCNKILRHAPGRVGIYLTLGRVCARKGMRGDATCNFLEYASRMQKEGRNEEAMTSLSEVASLMPELTEVRRLVEEHAVRVGIELPTAVDASAAQEQAKGSADSLVFLDIDYDAVAPTPPSGAASVPFHASANGNGSGALRDASTAMPSRTSSLDDLLIFDPSNPGDDYELPELLDGFEANSPGPLPDEQPVQSDSLVEAQYSTEALEPDTEPSVPEGLTDALGFEPADIADALPPAVLDGLVPETDEGMLLEIGSSVDSVSSESSAGSEWAAGGEDVLLDEEQNVEWLDFSNSDITLDMSIDNAMEAELAAQHGAGHDADPDADMDVDPHSSAPLEFLDLDAMEAIEDAGEALAPELSDREDDRAAAPVADEQGDAELELLDMAAEQLLDTNGSERFHLADEAPVTAPGTAPVTAPLDALVNVDAGLIVDYDEPEDAAALVDMHGRDDAAATVHIDGSADRLAIVIADGLEDAFAIELAHDTEATFPDQSAGEYGHGETIIENVPDAERAEAASVFPADDAVDLVHQSASSLSDKVAERWRTAVPRLNPHDFILPGELPPIVIPDALLPPLEVKSATPSAVDVTGIARNIARDDVPGIHIDHEHELVQDVSASLEHDVAREISHDQVRELAPNVEEQNYEQPSELIDARVAHDASGLLDLADDELDAVYPLDVVDELDVVVHLDEPDSVDPLDTVGQLENLDPSGQSSADDDTSDLDALLTPEAPTVVVNVALIRCERLREEADAHPGDWARRRRLAEALLEAGELEAGLIELATTSLGLEVQGAFDDTARVSDDMVRASPDNIGFHQKRVELAVRLGDRERLRESYLDLADALVRTGLAARAESVYVRVLELDPWDDRARIALGNAAPPPPARPSAKSSADDGYVSLADWLSDDGDTADTRMRLKEPTVTGDENADFDRLLQHFRDGVARSLGEDDYESHYDLGVAYKEMGLLDDAIAEFQRALRSPTHRLPAYEALGQCFLEQGSFPVAVTVLSRALHEPGLNDEQRVGVLYLLGYACEALQRRDEARSYYQRVYATDIQFRDVADRLAALEQVA